MLEVLEGLRSMGCLCACQGPQSIDRTDAQGPKAFAGLEGWHWLWPCVAIQHWIFGIQRVHT